MAERSLIDDLIDEREDAAPWMVTYGDMMTLLLVFFILLYTVFYFQTEDFKRDLSQLEIEVDGNGTTISVLDYARELREDGRQVRLEEATGLRQQRARVLEEIREIANENNWHQNATATAVGDKVKITLDGSALFASGRAELTPQADRIFADMLQTFQNYPDYQIKISGHTDNVPISTAKFSSNWELSAVRATTVLRFFTERGIDARRLTATGYADLFPIDGSDTPEGRARNRRVEFVLDKEKS
ncbi:MAG: OmpA family protein [Gammaproteobacteria bacterium]|nr:OmpA family protein [Gammaproteobacteria bacterium]